MEYYKIKAEKEVYLGKRYFRFKWDNPYVTQIVLHTGQDKKGKGHYVGIYLITKESFLANYLAMNVDKCTKAKFNKAMQDMYKRIK